MYSAGKFITQCRNMFESKNNIWDFTTYTNAYGHSKAFIWTQRKKMKVLWNICWNSVYKNKCCHTHNILQHSTSKYDNICCESSNSKKNSNFFPSVHIKIMSIWAHTCYMCVAYAHKTHHQFFSFFRIKK